MDFRELNYMIAVAKEQNISRAAEKLFVSQPSLSQAISSLEKRFGLKFFERGPQGVTLTYAGEQFLVFAEQILKIKDNMDIEMCNISRLATGKIRLGIPPLWSSYLLPVLLPLFKERMPEIEIDICEESSLFLEEKLIRGEIELAMLMLPVNEEDIKYQVLFKEKLLLAVSRENPLIEKARTVKGKVYPVIDPELLKNERFVLSPQHSPLRNSADKFFAANDIRPNIEMVTFNIETLNSLAGANVGITFIPERFISSNNRPPQPFYFRVGGSLEDWTIVIAKNKKTDSNTMVSRLASLIKDAVSHVQNEHREIQGKNK